MTSHLTLIALAALALPAAAGVIALDNPIGAGNQTFGGSVGLDFNTGLEPLEITHLGAFDSAQDGFATARTVQIYDRTNTATPYATVTIPAGTAATLVNGSRFWPVASTVTIPAGFQGSIVVSDVSTDAIHNQGVGAGPLSTINNGGGLLRFVGSGRYGSVGSFLAVQMVVRPTVIRQARFSLWPPLRIPNISPMMWCPAWQGDKISEVPWAWISMWAAVPLP